MTLMGFVTSTVIGVTDIGSVREHNEDAFIIAYPKTGQRLADRCRVTLPAENNSLLLAVSDGMGGARAGEVASAMTIESLITELSRLPKVLSPHSRLEAAVEAANYIVWYKQQEDKSLAGMGATLTSIFIERDWVYISEVGDSRAYIIRNGIMRQLTNDQTILQFLLDNNAITPENASTSYYKNMLLQAIGQQEYLQVACSSMRLRSGDVFLLCSDGLSGKMSKDEMHQLINESASLDIAAHRLINTAKERGGEDNITVILAQFDGQVLERSSETISDSIRVHTRFDPDIETKAQPMRKIREATYQDWLAMAVVGYYAETEQQKIALMSLGRYGDYIVFRKGDGLVFQGQRGPDTQYHYWLVSGRYRVEIELETSEHKTLAIIVPPTDMRSNYELTDDLGCNVPIKRQFFTASIAMLEQTNQRTATIWCEDNENIAIRVPMMLYQRVAEILGSRFLNAVKNS
ncbi:MAG: serine/threonine-protein phosphatase [Acidobacteria bacterium]|nr:serine/threonine-protein phosphatase [Acidobacteriota bacterium]